MDDADIAQGIEAAEREHSLATHSNRPIETPLIINDQRLCIDCEEPIPSKRLQAAPEAARCIFCQQLREQDHDR